jgi:hypothetical protein
MDKQSQTLAALVELANLPDRPEAVERFKAKHEAYEQYAVIDVRDALRKLWSNGEQANEVAGKLLFYEIWVPGSFDGRDRVPDQAYSPVNVRVDWKRGELVLDYEGLDELQMRVYELLKCSRLVKICARPDCPSTPYFIAQDSRTRYCSTDCADAMQDEWRRSWWNEHGTEWRKKRAKRSKVKGKR